MTTDKYKADPEPRVAATVTKWQEKILAAKKRYKNDFERMTRNMDFVAGLQRQAQESLNEEAYVANLTLRTLSQKKSVLYAKNPTTEAVRRERMDFQLWDGKMETLMQCIQSATTNPNDIHSLAVLNDYMVGMQRRQVIDKIGESLKLTYQWNVDQQEPAFKAQMKDLVMRVLTCGVGYVKMSFLRDDITPLADDGSVTKADRALRAKEILRKIDDGEVDIDDAVIEELRLLVGNQVTTSTEDTGDVKERLLMQFLPADSIIPDTACRSLRGFTGARWIAQEYMLPVNEVNEYFEVCVNATESVQLFNEDGEQNVEKDKQAQECLVRVWEVYDKRTMTCFYICEGYKDYLQAPEPIEPSIKHVWPIFPLVFNVIETNSKTKVTIFPPSDVDLLIHPQREWNRTREALKTHRRANAPKYVTSSELTKDDVAKIEDAAPHSVIKLESIPSGSDVSKLFVPIQHTPVNPTLYDTAPLQQDVLQSAGMQEANIGPVTGNETATGQTIAEQSRMTASASNVDDLDDFLTLLAESGGEMLMRLASEATVKQCAGVGSMWPEQYLEGFLTDVYLKISAASSGRPNKAVDVATFERLAPLLIQAGANPQAIVREGARRLGENVDIPSFFPIMNVQPSPGGVPQPQQSLQALPSQNPVPLPGA